MELELSDFFQEAKVELIQLPTVSLLLSAWHRAQTVSVFVWAFGAQTVSVFGHLELRPFLCLGVWC